MTSKNTEHKNNGTILIIINTVCEKISCIKFERLPLYNISFQICMNNNFYWRGLLKKTFISCFIPKYVFDINVKHSFTWLPMVSCVFIWLYRSNEYSWYFQRPSIFGFRFRRLVLFFAVFPTHKFGGKLLTYSLFIWIYSCVNCYP